MIDNIILIGKKEPIKYINSIIYQFIILKYSEVILKARGIYILKLIDIFEIIKTRFMKNEIRIDNIKIGSEEFLVKGKMIKVSTIEIIIINDKSKYYRTRKVI